MTFMSLRFSVPDVSAGQTGRIPSGQDSIPAIVIGNNKVRADGTCASASCGGGLDPVGG